MKVLNLQSEMKYWWRLAVAWLKVSVLFFSFFFSFYRGGTKTLSRGRLCHSKPNQYSLTFVVRCGAAGVRPKHRAAQRTGFEGVWRGPSQAISFVRDPTVKSEARRETPPMNNSAGERGDNGRFHSPHNPAGITKQGLAMRLNRGANNHIFRTIPPQPVFSDPAGSNLRVSHQTNTLFLLFAL